MNKTVKDQVSMLNTKLKNICSYYIPNKNINVDDKDPLWMTKSIKGKIDFKKCLFNSKIFIE